LNKKILVVGAGGIGSHLVPALQKHLTEQDTILLMDGDKFELKNMDRQMFSRRYIGKNKAAAVAEMYRGFNSPIVPLPEYLDDVVALSQRHSDISAIVACPDNHVARVRCMELADILGVVAVLCGNDFESSHCMVYDPAYKGTLADPVKVYPEMLTSTGHDPAHACTGVAQEENRQLATANFIAAGFGMGLLYCWYLSPLDTSGMSLSDATALRELLPFEYTWAKWGVGKSTIGEMLKRGDADEQGAAV